MIDLNDIKNFVGNIVERLFLIVYPPFGEKTFAEIDIRLGLIFKENPKLILTISIDVNEMWSPVLDFISIPSVHFNELDFQDRMQQWMEQKLNDDISLEYYEFTSSIYFKKIIQNKIQGIELLYVEGNLEPFGLKLLFENDYILTFPNSDGSTVETNSFNKNGNIEKFNYLGKVIYVTV